MVALKLWRRGAILLLLGLLLDPSLLGAEGGFLEAYKQGLKALDNRQWELAAEKMREAVAGRSEESLRLPKKGYLRKYLPHYYLGVALFELGDCAGALESWAESERQDVVTRRQGVYDDLRRDREQCQTQAPPTAPPERVEQPAEAKRPESRPPRKAEERQRPKRDDGPRPKRDDGPRPHRPVREIASPPTELDVAVRTFLDGDYARVIDVLEDFSAEEERTAAHAHLLRSAALFALHRVRGDDDLLIEARAEARAARAAEPELTLPERFFSPRFRELFQAMGGADQED